MGRFLNPDNSGFRRSLNSEIYVDKTGLIEYTNKVMNTEQAFICNSRPRRFGKSMAANMLAAYYSKGCDSSEMFRELEISSRADFEKHLNSYDVIHFDVQWCIEDAGGPEKTVEYINREVLSELRMQYPERIPDGVETIAGALSRINAATGNRFIVIIDEWDVFIRDDANNLMVQKEYIDFLRSLFKGTEPTKYIALAYMTGILPIKREKTQSALNNFDEFTMIDAGPLAKYMGFTEEEVAMLCTEHGCDFSEVKRWYDGYILDGYQVYNPKAVVSIVLRKRYQSYWSQTGTYESIRPYIDMNFDGLKDAVIAMMSGDRVPVRVKQFQNDMVTFKNKDDVLTLLIHLGYLAYDQEARTAFVPNEEIRSEFVDAVEDNKWSDFDSFRATSHALLDATISMNEDAVAEGIDVIHTEYAPAIRYNDENSLSSVLTIAYLSTLKYYYRPKRELPTGRGFADFVYIPKPEYACDYPAIIAELKWNKDAETALQQIKDRNYPESIRQYTGNILLVGISYDKKTKKHECVIESLKK